MTRGPARSPELVPGSQLAGYLIRSVLAVGDLSTLYLAEGAEGALCALKVLSPQLGLDPSARVRFKREAEYAEALDHPHILELYDTGETPDGTLFLAMQYVPGADLRTMLSRSSILDLPTALAILGQIGDALDCAHSSGLIHRDVKPANILVADEHREGPYAYLTDFGLSKNPSADSIALTKQGQFVGTTAYTAPEEILAQPRDHRVDIYSLGCVLYEALVGTPPFVGDRDLDVLYAHIGDPRPSLTDRQPQLPAGIDPIVAKAMAISPADRYATCAELIAAVGALLPDSAPASPDIVPGSPDVAAGPPDVPHASPDIVPAADPPPRQPPDRASSSHEDPTVPAAPVAPPASLGPDDQLRLVVIEGLGLGSELIVSDELELGRLTTLGGLLAPDRGISRRHGRVTRAADGGFEVIDDHSANGTFVNGTRVAGRHPLAPGDALRIGSTVFAASAVDRHSIPPDPQAELHLVAPIELGEAKRLVLRLEVDLEAGELLIAFEDGPAARIVRHGDGWQVKAP
jgi:serine/threonine protein kinase